MQMLQTHFVVRSLSNCDQPSSSRLHRVLNLVKHSNNKDKELSYSQKKPYNVGRMIIMEDTER